MRWFHITDPVLDEATRTQTLRRIYGVFMVANLCAVVAVAVAPAWRVFLPLSLVLVPVWFVAHWLVRTGRTDASAWLGLLGLCATVGVSAAWSGGITAYSLATLSVTICAAGLVLDGRRAAWIAALSLAIVSGLALYDHFVGPLTPVTPFGPVSILLLLTSLFFGTLTVTVAAGHEIRRHREESDAARRVIEERNRQLALAEQRYGEISDLTSDSFYAVNVDAERNTAWEIASPGIERITGYAVEQLTNEAWREILPPELLAEFGEHIRARESGASAVEVLIATRTGERRWVRNESRIVPGEDGSFRVFGVVRDIQAQREAEAERARLEAELRQAQKMDAVGRLAGGIAHDFNNLLTAIIGFAEMMRFDLKDRPDAVYAAEQITTAADRASELTAQLLLFGSRPATSEPQPLVFDSVLEELEPMLARVLGETVDVVLALGARDARIHGDRGAVEQVIVNLAVNARDAIAETGSLLLETERVVLDPAAEGDEPGGEAVRLTVRDDGCGMSAEVSGRIFEPFFTTKGPDAGSGLGLSTVYGIVRQHGGRIEVSSVEGEGSCFVVDWPLWTGDVEAVKEEAPRVGALLPERAKRAAHVLVAEDDDRVRSLVYRCLERAGHHVCEARNGAEAIEIVENGATPIDLVITDVVMPEMDGVQLVERLHDEWPELPVLAMSGYANTGARGRRRLPPDVPFLQKPFGPTSLLRKLNELLDA